MHIIYYTSKYAENLKKHKGFYVKNHNITAQVVEPEPVAETPVTGQPVAQPIAPPVTVEPVVPEVPEAPVTQLPPVPTGDIKQLLQYAITYKLPLSFNYMSILGNYTADRSATPEEFQRVNYHDLVLTMDHKKNDYRYFLIDGMDDVKLQV